MDIIKLIKKLIKGSLIAWLVFVLLGTIIMGLVNSELFKDSGKPTTKVLNSFVKDFQVKSGATELKVLSDKNYKASMYQLPTTINIWDIKGTKILYSTEIRKQKLEGLYFDLNIYNMETGDIDEILKMDPSNSIFHSSFNDSYVSWSQGTNLKVMDLYSKEIVYEVNSTWGDCLYKDTLYTYSDGKLHEVSLKDKSEMEVDLGIKDINIYNIIAKEKFVALTGEDKVIVYNKDDKTTVIKETDGESNFSDIIANENRLIFTPLDIKKALEYNLETKAFESYKIHDDFNNDYITSYNEGDGIYVASKIEDKNILKVLDVLDNEKLTINIDEIEYKDFTIYSHEDGLLLSLVGGGPGDIWRCFITIVK